MNRDFTIQEQALERAIEKTGSISGLARAVSRALQERGATYRGKQVVSRFTVMRWQRRGQVPAEIVPMVSLVSGVPRSSLRPDLFAKGDI